MKLSLTATLIEQHKKHKDEMGVPPFGTLSTPDNHTSGKRSKTVKTKRPSGDITPKLKKVAQVGAPKKRERRKMVEGKAGAPKYILTNFMVDHDRDIKQFVILDGDGVTVTTKDMSTDDIRALADKHKLEFISAMDYRGLLSGAERRNRGAYQESGDTSVHLRNPTADGTDKDEGLKPSDTPVEGVKNNGPKPKKIKVAEDFADNGKSGDILPVDNEFLHWMDAVGKDEGMKKPKVAKMAKIARHGKTGGTIGDEKTNTANVGKTRKLPKTYMGGERVEVAKVHESLRDIAEFLGTDLTVSTDMVESYPDDFDGAAFDRAYGTDADDKAHDNAMENLEYEVQEYLKNEGPGFITDYKKYKNHPKGKADPEWYMENLGQLVEGAMDIAYTAIQTEGYDFEVDNDLVKSLLETYMANAGVAPEDIIEAFTDVIQETTLDEDSLSRWGDSNDIHGAEVILQHLGYSVIGGGFVGGQKSYKNREGNIVSVSVNTFKPTEVIGWKSQDGKSGKTVTDMSSALQGSSKPRGMFSRFDKYKNRGSANENSSGGAVGAGAIASTAGAGRPQSQLFAGETDVEEAHGTGEVYLDYSRRIDAMGKHGNFNSMWTTVNDAVTHDDRLTHNEISDLQSALHRAKEQRIKTPSGDDIVNIPQDIDTYVAQLDKFLEPTYYLSWEEAAGDRELIAKAIEKGMTPEEFGAAWARSTGMDTVDDNWG